MKSNKMALSQDDFRQIKEVIRQTMDEYFQDKGVKPSELAGDLYFVQGWREGTKTIRKASWWTIVTLVITGTAALIWGTLTKKF